MTTNFKIATYKKDNDNFIKTGYDDYEITYLKGIKIHQLRIVVNGYLTKKIINLVDLHQGYKNQILGAISEYRSNSTPKNKVVNKITMDYMKSFYSKNIIKNIENYLININKEESRDKLTKFNLI